MNSVEKAIIYFKDMRKRLCEDHLNICPKDSIAYKATLAEKDFYDTAIQALQKEPCTDYISRKTVVEILNHQRFGISKMSWDIIFEKLSELPPVTPQSCEDNAKAFQIGMALGFGEKYDEMDKVMEEVKKAISPHPKMGKWLKKEIHDGSIVNVRNICSNCGITNASVYKNYCPNCGTKMVEPQESEGGTQH